MTQKDKELLLEDICSRLPYGVKCQIQEDEDTYVGTLHIIEVDNIHGHLLEFVETISGLNCQVYLSEIKPYLFPLSSMTDELWDKEFDYGITEFTRDSFKYGCETLEFYDGNPVLSDVSGFINLLIKNHFDIYGLIPMGLALDATGLNIY